MNNFEQQYHVLQLMIKQMNEHHLRIKDEVGVGVDGYRKLDHLPSQTLLSPNLCSPKEMKITNARDHFVLWNHRKKHALMCQYQISRKPN